MDPNDDDDTHTDLPPALLIDPERSDIKDPLDALIDKEQNMDTDKAQQQALAPTKREQRALNKALNKRTISSPLPPLTADGLAPAQPINHTAPPRTPDVTERRKQARAADDVWSELERRDSATVVANALATKMYIAHAGDAAHDAQLDPADPTTTTQMLLMNPFTSYIPSLYKLDSFRGYMASNVIATSLGYAVILALLAEYRAARRETVPEPQLDYESKWAKLLDEERAAKRTEELGFYKLPVFHAETYAGVYMRLVYDQRADPEWGPQRPVMRAHEILHALHTGQMDNNPALAAAYSSLERSTIGEDNPALANILQTKQQIRAQMSEAEQARQENETAYILTLLGDTRPVEFSDALWYEMPLYIQTRYSTMVYNQIVRAIGRELNPLNRLKRDTDYVKVKELSTMLGVLHLEIESALRTAEVLAAFEQGKLDNRHDIRTKKVKPDAPKKPAMQRGVAPAPDDDADDIDGDIA